MSALRNLLSTSRQKRLGMLSTLIVFLLVTATQILWMDSSVFVLRHDSPRHAYVCSHLSDNLLMPTFPYPLLLHGLGNLALAISDRSPWAFFAVQTLAMGLIVIFASACGRSLGQRQGGLLAALFSLSPPLILTYWRHFFTDYLMAAICMANLYFYLRSDRLRRPLWNALFMFSIIVASFTRYEYIAFAIIFLPAIALDIFLEDRRLEQRPVRTYVLYQIGISLSCLLGSLAGYIWLKGHGLIVTDIIWAFVAASILIALLNLAWEYKHSTTRTTRFFTHIWLVLAVAASLYLNFSLHNTNEYSLHVHQYFGGGYEGTLSPHVLGLRFIAMFTSLKGYVLAPLLFWPTLGGLIYLLCDSQRRQKYLVIIITTVAYIPLVHFCSGCDRFYSPMLGFCPLLAAALFQEWPRLARGYSLLLLAYILSITAGWLLPESWIPRCPATAPFHNSISYDRYQKPISGKEHIQQKGNRVRYFLDDGLSRLTYRDETKLSQLTNLGTIWSDSLFFTIPPYTVPWDKCFRDLAELLPPWATVSVYFTEDPQWNDEISNIDELSAFVLFHLDFIAPEKHFLPEQPLQMHDKLAFLVTINPPAYAENHPMLYQDEWGKGRHPLNTALLYRWDSREVTVCLWEYSI